VAKLPRYGRVRRANAELMVFPKGSGRDCVCVQSYGGYATTSVAVALQDEFAPAEADAFLYG